LKHSTLRNKPSQTRELQHKSELYYKNGLTGNEPKQAKNASEFAVEMSVGEKENGSQGAYFGHAATQLDVDMPLHYVANQSELKNGQHALSRKMRSFSKLDQETESKSTGHVAVDSYSKYESKDVFIWASFGWLAASGVAITALIVALETYYSSTNTLFSSSLPLSEKPLLLGWDSSLHFATSFVGIALASQLCFSLTHLVYSPQSDSAFNSRRLRDNTKKTFSQLLWSVNGSLLTSTLLAFAATLCELFVVTPRLEPYNPFRSLLAIVTVVSLILYTRDYVFRLVQEKGFSKNNLDKTFQPFFSTFKKSFNQALEPTEEEEYFTKRAIQLIWLAALMGSVTSLVQGFSVSSSLFTFSIFLLLVPLPLVVELVPVLRASIIKALYQLGVLIPTPLTLDGLESVSSLALELPSATLTSEPPFNNGIWKFERLEVIDERYDHEKLASVIISLIAHSKTACAATLCKGLRETYPKLGSVTQIARHREYPEGAFTGEIEGVSMVIGKEAFLIQQGIFLDHVHSDSTNLPPSEDTSPENSIAQVVTFYVAVGYSCAARITMRLRWNYRGLEVAVPLMTKQHIRVSAFSTGPAAQLDDISRRFGLELSQSHGGLSEQQMLTRLAEGHFDAMYIDVAHLNKIPSSVEKPEGFIKLITADGNVPQERAHEYVQLISSSSHVIETLFKFTRESLIVRQTLLVSSVVCSALLFVFTLFKITSSLVVLLSLASFFGCLALGIIVFLRAKIN
jgi:hypothetical protein